MNDRPRSIAHVLLVCQGESVRLPLDCSLLESDSNRELWERCDQPSQNYFSTQVYERIRFTKEGRGTRSDNPLGNLELSHIQLVINCFGNESEKLFGLDVLQLTSA
jgi:hypothetical protein